MNQNGLSEYLIDPNCIEGIHLSIFQVTPAQTVAYLALVIMSIRMLGPVQAPLIVFESFYDLEYFLVHSPDASSKGDHF